MARTTQSKILAISSNPETIMLLLIVGELWDPEVLDFTGGWITPEHLIEEWVPDQDLLAALFVGGSEDVMDRIIQDLAEDDSDAVDPVVIINNTTVIATLAYLTICCNCNGHN